MKVKEQIQIKLKRIQHIKVAFIFQTWKFCRATIKRFGRSIMYEQNMNENGHFINKDTEKGHQSNEKTNTLNH